MRCNAPCEYNVDGECWHIAHWGKILKSLLEPTILEQRQSVLVEYLRKYGDMDRDTLSAMSKMPRSTVYDTIQKLIIKGIVETYKKGVKHTGRKRIIYRLA